MLVFGETWTDALLVTQGLPFLELSEQLILAGNMDPTRTICVGAITSDFDGWKKLSTYELPENMHSLSVEQFVNLPDVEQIIKEYLNEFQDTLDAIDVHLMFDPETMSGTKPLWRITASALKQYYARE